MDNDSNSSSNIRVICRFRPVNDRERSESPKAFMSFDFNDTNCVKIVNNDKESQAFTFDNVFHNTATTQEEVYECSAKETITDVIRGYNGTIFAYGQTGSGKSHSMFGPDIRDPELCGIIPRACKNIFDHIRSTQGIEFRVTCSFLEIYKEIVRDLLNPSKINLKVRDAPGKGVWVEGLSEFAVKSEEDVIKLLQLGEKVRAVSATNMNAVSSRSHSLFILTLQQKFPDGSLKTGKLNLADLAGSEKVGKTGAAGETLEEAKKINQSLSALGNCIFSLTKAQRGHVNYRDSKLTHILKESLGGNCKTTLLITCSPHAFNIEETISTLKFGQRAKMIKNKASVNRQQSVAELNAVIVKLMHQMKSLQNYIGVLEHDLVGFDANYDFEAAKNRCSVVMSPQVTRRNSTAPHVQNVKQQQEAEVQVEKKAEEEVNTSAVDESTEEPADPEEEEEEEVVIEEFMKELSIDPSIEMFLNQILPSGLNRVDSGTIGGTLSVDDLNLDNLTLDSDLEDYVNGLLQNVTFS